MTAVAMPYAGNRGPLDAEVADRAAGGPKWVIADALTLTKRNLIAYTRIPEAAFFSSVQPIMFVLLFRYVFGGAIHIPGTSYVDFLLPGIFVQTVAFGSIGTAIGLAEDLQKGLIERFRALPMSRSAVLAGRTLADFVRNIAVMILMLAVGYLVGFRLHGPALHIAAGIGLVLLFSYALSWGFAYVGLAARNSETAQLMAFPVLFPLTFASSAFVVDLDDARLAAGVGGAPTGVPGLQRRARAADRPADRELRLAVARLGRRVAGRAVDPGGPQVPEDRLSSPSFSSRWRPEPVRRTKSGRCRLRDATGRR